MVTALPSMIMACCSFPRGISPEMASVILFNVNSIFRIKADDRRFRNSYPPLQKKPGIMKRGCLREDIIPVGLPVQ
jgi:hypothetical protein